MRILSLALVLILFSSCSAMTMKKIRYEDCIVKLREAEVPPLKALKICEKIHDRDGKDLATEEQLAKE